MFERNELISLIKLVKKCNFDHLYCKPGCYVAMKSQNTWLVQASAASSSEKIYSTCEVRWEVQAGEGVILLCMCILYIYIPNTLLLQ
jgi:hypothetical protein